MNAKKILLKLAYHLILEGSLLKKKIIITVLSVLVLGLFYNFFVRPLNWRINRNEIESMTLDNTLSSEQINKVLKSYNSMYKISKRTTMNGSTPRYVLVIKLKSGEEISVQDCGGGFIVERVKEKVKGAKCQSYWARSKNLYEIWEQISGT